MLLRSHRKLLNSSYNASIMQVSIIARWQLPPDPALRLEDWGPLPSVKSKSVAQLDLQGSQHTHSMIVLHCQIGCRCVNDKPLI